MKGKGRKSSFKKGGFEKKTKGIKNRERGGFKDKNNKKPRDSSRSKSDRDVNKFQQQSNPLIPKVTHKEENKIKKQKSK